MVEAEAADHFKDWIREGVLILHLTDEDKDELAAKVGETRAEMDEWYAQVIRQWTELDPDDLTDDEYRALFDRDKDPVPGTIFSGMTGARFRNLTDEERDESAAELLMSRAEFDAQFEAMAEDWDTLDRVAPLE